MTIIKESICKNGHERSLPENIYVAPDGHKSCRRCRLDRISKPLWTTWIGIRNRCTNPNQPGFKNYGARGITMFPDWIHGNAGYEAFYTHVSNLPRFEDRNRYGLTLDRINTFGNYEPDNLRWATPQEQRMNQRPSQTRSRLRPTVTNPAPRIRPRLLDSGVSGDVHRDTSALR